MCTMYPCVHIIALCNVHVRAKRESIRSQLIHSKGSAYDITKYQTFLTKYVLLKGNLLTAEGHQFSWVKCEPQSIVQFTCAQLLTLFRLLSHIQAELVLTFFDEWKSDLNYYSVKEKVHTSPACLGVKAIWTKWVIKLHHFCGLLG